MGKYVAVCLEYKIIDDQPRLPASDRKQVGGIRGR